MKISAKEARERFSEILDRAERGEEVVILRRGKPAVRLSRAQSGRHPRLPGLAEFRALIHIKGRLTDALLKERKKSRY
ncbi:MAG TPA: type II toxin-antitoxin system prevent-host-death family antitoxin [Acidiferrobacterales bacterium]|nr:type II toxin-antitoxin system prevent-host-death family antitoxin [Acidiferrobacterales bacterium]